MMKHIQAVSLATLLAVSFAAGAQQTTPPATGGAAGAGASEAASGGVAVGTIAAGVAAVGVIAIVASDNDGGTTSTATQTVPSGQ